MAIKKDSGKKKKKLPPGVRERDGRYTYRYSVYVYENGQKRRKQKETESYPTAQAAYDAGVLIKADQLRGKLVDSTSLSVLEWRDRWIEDFALERESSYNTISARKNGTNSFIRFVGSHTPLKEITLDIYQRWLNNLKKEGKKKNTLLEYHTSTKIMFSDAVRKGALQSNPTDNVILPVYKKSVKEIESGELELPKYFEKQELKLLLNTIRFRGDSQDHRITIILAYTGMRIGETAALNTTDYIEDPDTMFSITKTLANHCSKNYVIGPPKTTTSIRRVMVGSTVIKAIKDQLKWREQMIKDERIVHNANFLFWSRKFPGYPMSVAAYEERFKKYLKMAGLPESLTPHSLRHTHVSLLAEAGVPLPVIQERLGHQDDDVTERIYLHVTKGQRKQTPDRFEIIMSG